jgi:hypothetical protein
MMKVGGSRRPSIVKMGYIVRFLLYDKIVSEMDNGSMVSYLQAVHLVERHRELVDFEIALYSHHLEDRL